jgi:hypothetical protein
MTPADEERLDASVWFWSADLVERAGFADIERGSGNVVVSRDGATMRFSISTTSRGRVTLGTIRTAVIDEVAAALNADQLAAFREHVREAKAAALDIVLPYAEHLEATRRAPLEGKARASNARINRAVELKKAGNSPARIAQIMTGEGSMIGSQDPARSVRRWLATAKSRTDRERSDSR